VGLIPAAAAGTWRDKNGKKSPLLIKCHTQFEMDNKARYFKGRAGILIREWGQLSNVI
jgi:hypothetical protein